MGSSHEHELPMLAGIAACLRWLEELAGILAGPLLTIGLAIALIDLLTDGGLLASQPELLYAWAVAMAAGVDAQLVGSAAKAAAAIRARRPWAVIGYLALVGVLAYVAYVASLVFSTQEASGITTAAALARLGMDSTSWLWQRSALAVVLVVLSGFLRYVPPAASASARAADERAKLERELELEPLRAELRARKAIGWRGVVGAIANGPNLGLSGQSDSAAPTIAVDAPTALPSPAEAPERPPTGPGSPAVRTPRRKRAVRTPSRPARPAVLKLTPVPPAERIRAVLEADAAASISKIAREAGVGKSTASKHRAIWRTEQRQQSQQLAQ